MAKRLILLFSALLAGCQKPAAERPSTQALAHQRDSKISATPTQYPDEAASSVVPKSEQPVEETRRILTAEPMTPADFRARVEAVKQLGRKRSVEAVPLLIDGLMKLTPLTSGNILDFEESYPASAALVQIGEPAVAQIARRFEVTPSELERLVLLDTLIRIKGKEWVVTYLSEVVKRDEGRISKVKLGELQAWAKSR